MLGILGIGTKGGGRNASVPELQRLAAQFGACVLDLRGSHARRSVGPCGLCHR